MKKLIAIVFCLCLTLLAVCPNVMAQFCDDYAVDVVQETAIRSRWLPSVALITIKGTDTGWTFNNYEITYSAEISRNLFWLPGTPPFMINQTIKQLIILLPSWFTACCWDGSVETMTVEVCNTDTECCDEDTVAIAMVPLGLDY